MLAGGTASFRKGRIRPAEMIESLVPQIHRRRAGQRENPALMIDERKDIVGNQRMAIFGQEIRQRAFAAPVRAEKRDSFSADIDRGGMQAKNSAALQNEGDDQTEQPEFYILRCCFAVGVAIDPASVSWQNKFDSLLSVVTFQKQPVLELVHGYRRISGSILYFSNQDAIRKNRIRAAAHTFQPEFDVRNSTGGGFRERKRNIALDMQAAHPVLIATFSERAHLVGRRAFGFDDFFFLE